MASVYKYLKVENVAGLRKLIISNSAKKNALDIEAYIEITDALRMAAIDDSVSIVALTGEGEYYSSGNDITKFLAVKDPQNEIKAAYNALKSLINGICEFPKLLICVVNGPCIGIAVTTAVLCDIIYATENAFFYTPFTKLGLCPEGCASFTFQRILGKSKASEMLFLGHKLSAQEALQFNLISKVYNKSNLNSELWLPLIESSKLPPGSLRVTKKLMNAADLKNLEDACDRELKELFIKFESEEFLQAVMDFVSRKSKL